jgi:hypothetical protein
LTLGNERWRSRNSSEPVAGLAGEGARKGLGLITGCFVAGDGAGTMPASCGGEAMRWSVLPVASQRSGSATLVNKQPGELQWCGRKEVESSWGDGAGRKGELVMQPPMAGAGCSGSHEDETRRPFIGGRVERRFAHINSTMWSRDGHIGGGDVRWRTAAARLARQRWPARHDPCARGACRKGIGPGWRCGVGQSHLAHMGEHTPRRPSPASGAGARSGAVGVWRHGSAFQRDFHFSLA